MGEKFTNTPPVPRTTEKQNFQVQVQDFYFTRSRAVEANYEIHISSLSPYARWWARSSRSAGKRRLVSSIKNRFSFISIHQSAFQCAARAEGDITDSPRLLFFSWTEQTKHLKRPEIRLDSEISCELDRWQENPNKLKISRFIFSPRARGTSPSVQGVSAFIVMVTKYWSDGTSVKERNASSICLVTAPHERRCCCCFPPLFCMHSTHDPFFWRFLCWLVLLMHSYSLTPTGLIIARTPTPARGSSSSSSSAFSIELEKKNFSTYTNKAWKKLFRVVFLQLFSWEGTVKRLKWEFLS